MNYLPHLTALSGIVIIFPALFFLLRGLGYSTTDAIDFITISGFGKKNKRKEKYKSYKFFIIGLSLLILGISLLLSAFLVDITDGGIIWGNSRITL